LRLGYAAVSVVVDAVQATPGPFRLAGLRPIQRSNPNVLAILAMGRNLVALDPPQHGQGHQHHQGSPRPAPGGPIQHRLAG